MIDVNFSKIKIDLSNRVSKLTFVLNRYVLLPSSQKTYLQLGTFSMTEIKFQMYNVNDITNSWGDNRIADDWVKEMIPLARFGALKFPV